MRTFVDKSPKESGAMQTLYFNKEQTKELIGIADTIGLVLMQHYVAIAHQTKPNMEDAVLALTLDKSELTIRTIRLKLTKYGWFKRVKTTIKGETHIMYAVGKQAVNNYSYGKVAVLSVVK